jgi:uncharacterized lipoprotein
MLVVLYFLLTGCGAVVLFGAGAASGVVGYKYYKGTLNVIFQAPYMETWNASLEALKQMDIKVERSDHTLVKGKIQAKNTDQESVTISVKYKSEKETEVVIRVGLLGDKDASMTIKERIRKVLFEE